MQYLNQHIEAMVKRKESRSLVKKQISCGIFQDLETVGQTPKKVEKKL